MKHFERENRPINSGSRNCGSGKLAVAVAIAVLNIASAQAADAVIGGSLYVATDGPVTLTVTKSSTDAGLVRMWYGTDGSGSNPGAVLQRAGLGLNGPVGSSLTVDGGAIAGQPFGASWPAGTDLVFQMVAFGALISPRIGQYQEIPTQRTGTEYARSIAGMPLAAVVFGANNTAEIGFLTPMQNGSFGSFERSGFRILVTNVTGVACH